MDQQQSGGNDLPLGPDGSGGVLRRPDHAPARDQGTHRDTRQDAPDAPGARTGRVMWEAGGRASGRVARFLARPNVSETFQYTLHDWEGVTYTWDIAALQQRANGRAIRLEPIAPLAAILERGEAEVDARRVMTDPSIDIDLPLLALPLPFPTGPKYAELCIVADGWHRACRAWAAGRTEIPMVIMDREDEAAVRLSPSTRQLSEILLPQIAARQAEAERQGARPEGVLTLAADGGFSWLPPESGPVCDFCNGRPVAWCYPARSFVLEAYGWQSVGNWAACGACSRLIEYGRLPDLTRRCIDSMAPTIERELGGREPLDIRKYREGLIATQHATFAMNRCGERHPHHPMPAHGIEGPHTWSS